LSPRAEEFALQFIETLSGLVIELIELLLLELFESLSLALLLLALSLFEL
jgi:hypothetical protein